MTSTAPIPPRHDEALRNQPGPTAGPDDGDDPTDLESRIRSLSPARQELLRRRLAAGRSEHTPPAPPGPAPGRPLGPVALSAVQRRLWFLEQLTPGTSAYSVAVAWRLSGPLHVEVLRRALHEVVGRHEALRMRFRAGADGGPLVEIDAEAAVPLTEIDLPDQPGRPDQPGLPDRGEAARQVLEADLGRPLDIGRSVLRATLVRLGDDDHVLCLVVHHLVFDAVSARIVGDELFELYRAALAGTGPRIGPEPPGYGDHAARERTDPTDHSAAVAHWHRHLAGVPPLALPTDRPFPEVRSLAGGWHRTWLDPHLAAAVNRLARQRRATPFEVLLAAYQALLGWFCDQDDFAVGCLVAGRDVPGTETMVGMLVDTLALRADLTGDPSFASHLDRVRAANRAGLANARAPFDQVVDLLRPARDASRSPVFQVLFSYQTWIEPVATDDGAGPAGLTIEPFDVHNPSSRHELALQIMPDGDRLRIYTTYASALFDPTTIDRFLTRYARLLRQVVEDPELPLSSIDLLGTGERERVLTLSEGPVQSPPPVPTLDRIIDRWVDSGPDRVAVRDADTSLTYGDLAASANRLANHLRRLGVGVDDRVGICLPPSTGQAVVVLAVLRAGGAYVPLDPDLPPARISRMLDDAGVDVVVTRSELLDRVAGRPGERVVLDVDGPGLDACPSTAPPPVAGPDDLAYVIFTSGSTGFPKGVAVPHRSVLRYLYAAAERIGIGPGERFLLPQPLSYDFSMTMFYLPLLTGGSVRLVPARSTAEEIAAVIAAEGIDHLKLTPSHLEALCAEVDTTRLLPRRSLLVAGEASRADWAHGLARVDGPVVFNHYGPTEASVAVTMYRVEPGTGATTATLPIGTPLAGAVVRILDRALRPVPVGAVGELHLGGDRLARGYLGRPGLTADRFVPDPAGPPGARLYRTGDLGRWLPSGDIEFLGRRDHQLKVRGYRIEPAEVEAALGALDQVAAAVVTGEGDRLVAYLERSGPATADLSVRGLRDVLVGTLPEPFLPARAVWLDRLPLQASGKIDRQELARIGAAGPAVVAGTTAPDGPVEGAIAAVMADALGIDRVGADDDFFDLGGHSLLAVQIVSRLRNALPEGSGSVTVMDLFSAPTVRGLARLAAAGPRSDDELLHRLTGPPTGTTPAVSYVCVPYGGASAVVYQPLADALPDDHALYAVALPGHDISRADLLDDEVIPVGDIAAGCVAAITARIEGPLVIYGHCGPGGAVALEIARLLEASGRDLDAVYLGGVFPFSRPDNLLGRIGHRFRLDRFRHDTVYATWLLSIGADVGALDPEERSFLIRAMRHDAEAAEEYFTSLLARNVARLRAPLIAVIGERDPATEYHQERFREWGFVADTVAAVVIDEAGHYFLKWRAAELAAIVTTVHQTLPASAPSPPSPPSPPSAPSGDPAVRGRSSWWLEAVTSGDGADRAEPASRAMGPFLAVVASQMISATGTALTEFAFPLWAYLDTGSMYRFALFAVIALLPGMLALPVAGAVVDRHDRRAMLLAGSAVAGSVQVVLAVLVGTGHHPLPVVYVLLALLSVALQFQRLAFASAVPQLVPKIYLGHANGVVQLTTNTANFIVPLLAVALLSTIGLAGILVLDVVSYLVAVAVLAAVRFPAALPWRRRETMAAEIAAGFRYFWARPGLRAMLGFFVATNSFLAAVLVLLSPLVLSVGDLADAGRLATVASAGGILGGLTMALWGGPRHYRMRGMLWASIWFAVGAVLTGLRPDLWLIGVGAAVAWFAMAVQNGIWFTIVQVKVPYRFHARVVALNFMVAQSVVALGFGLAPLWADLLDPLVAEAGPLAGTVGRLIGTGPGRGIALVYLVCGVAIAAVSTVALNRTVLARFDDEVPDAEPDDLVGLRAVGASAGRPRASEVRAGGDRAGAV